MILFIANHAFPDHSGFSNRCQNALQALQQLDKVVIVCQQYNQSHSSNSSKNTYKNSPVYRYGINHQSIERTNKRKYISGWYEIKRNINLFWNMIITLSKVINKYKSKEKIKAYVVVSPLTTPLYVYFISLFLPLELAFVEFHDLEPETAMHLKALQPKNFVMKIEYYLEKCICRKYRKIVVTNSIQKERLVQRTGVKEETIFVLPNILETQNILESQKQKATIVSRKTLLLSDKDFIVAYSSSLSYEYTTNGVVYIIDNLPAILKKIPHLKLIIIGGGDGLEIIHQTIQKNKCKHLVITTGKIPNVQDYLAISDVAIIPWDKDVMTETILPTKLFEYMSARKAIVAPDFGEFKRVINGKNGLLFQDKKEMVQTLFKLYTQPSLKVELGQNAYTYYMQEYNPSMLLKKFKSFLQEP